MRGHPGHRPPGQGELPESIALLEQALDASTLHGVWIPALDRMEQPATKPTSVLSKNLGLETFFQQMGSTNAVDHFVARKTVLASWGDMAFSENDAFTQLT